MGLCDHGMARPQVAGAGTASNIEGSCEYIEQSRTADSGWSFSLGIHVYMLLVGNNERRRGFERRRSRCSNSIGTQKHRMCLGSRYICDQITGTSLMLL